LRDDSIDPFFRPIKTVVSVRAEPGDELITTTIAKDRVATPRPVIAAETIEVMITKGKGVAFSAIKFDASEAIAQARHSRPVGKFHGISQGCDCRTITDLDDHVVAFSSVQIPLFGRQHDNPVDRSQCLAKALVDLPYAVSGRVLDSVQ
jgi:hypothetical protein